MRKIASAVAIACTAATLAASPEATAQRCPSRATIDIQSSGYSGTFSVELRRGNRPGSVVVATRSLQAGGQQSFAQVCPGRYFFSFGAADSDTVSVTQYFDVRFDGTTYNNPTIRVFYSRNAGEGQTVGTAKKSDL